MKLMQQKGQALIILLTILFVGSSTTAIGVLLTGKTIPQIKKEVSATIANKQRIKKINAVLDAWKDEVAEQEKKAVALRKEMFQLYQRHDTRADQLEKIFSKIDDLNRESIAMILNSRFALIEQMSADEWSRIFSKERKDALPVEHP